ncbi:hypothetical protein LXL04_007549 [Taraxacum kok-saghyz]
MSSLRALNGLYAKDIADIDELLLKVGVLYTDSVYDPQQVYKLPTFTGFVLAAPGSQLCNWMSISPEPDRTGVGTGTETMQSGAPRTGPSIIVSLGDTIWEEAPGYSPHGGKGQEFDSWLEHSWGIFPERLTEFEAQTTHTGIQSPILGDWVQRMGVDFLFGVDSNSGLPKLV